MDSEINALWSRRAARVLVNIASRVPIRGASTSFTVRTLLVRLGSKLPEPRPVTVWIAPGTMAPCVFTGGAGVYLVTQMVPPKTHSVVLVGGAATGPLPIVVRNAVLFTKTKPEVSSLRPAVSTTVTRLLIGTRDEFRRLAPTTYWPLFDAAYAPEQAM